MLLKKFMNSKVEVIIGNTKMEGMLVGGDDDSLYIQNKKGMLSIVPKANVHILNILTISQPVSFEAHQPLSLEPVAQPLSAEKKKGKSVPEIEW